MVLTANKKIIFLATAFLINASLVCTSPVGYTISGLVQYGENIDRERLELQEDHQVIRITGNAGSNTAYSITGVYTIRNNGNEYRATLAILIGKLEGTPPSFLDIEIQFFVNNEPVSYNEIITQDGVVMGENRIEFHSYSTAWALIDVLFPENSVVTIRVQYVNTLDSYYERGGTSSILYNKNIILSYFLPKSSFPELLHWKGPTKFSVEIINDDIDQNNVEYNWIACVCLFHTEDTSKNIYTSIYLTGLQEPETDLMKIQKIDRNTFRIEFTEIFTSSYDRSIAILLRVWEGVLSPYFTYNYVSKEISLYYGSNPNITQRKLAPYEMIFLTNSQLRVMRNAFYARHGYIFSSRELRDIFDSLNYSDTLRFYEPNPNFHEGMLTDIERANIETIRRLEALAGD